MKPHHKPLVGGLVMLGALAVAVISYAGRPEANFLKPEVLFRCEHVDHHDGDAIRCGGKGRSMRLYAIDAPEMPGACRPGRQCTPGDPYASRDHLRALTTGKAVQCRQLDTDRYGRPVVQCFSGGADLSCSMVSDGFAVERYGRLRCR